jgi:anti-sigma B factor antagonist
MAPPSAKLLVYTTGHSACVRIAGRANFTSSIDFKMLLNGLVQKGYDCFVLDLSDCILMDSTFLGVLAGFGLKMTTPQNGEPKARPIQLLNPNQRIAELLENLGVAHLFKTVTRPDDLPGELAVDTPPDGTPPDGTPPDGKEHSREEVTRNCLEAHKLLMEIAPGNVSKFKEVAQFLAEDLKKTQTGP